MPNNLTALFQGPFSMNSQQAHPIWRVNCFVEDSNEQVNMPLRLFCVLFIHNLNEQAGQIKSEVCFLIRDSRLDIKLTKDDRLSL